MKRVLIIQNDAAEGAGLLGSLLEDHRILVETVFGWTLGEERPEHEDYDALVVLGGVQGAYELDRYPYLAHEIELCKSFTDAPKPVLGICLGAQLLAVALGGRVGPNTHSEIGWLPITLDEAAQEDPLMTSLPRRMEVFHFHGDVIETPPGCDNLASSALTPCQLFSAGPGVYGFQFHAEIDRTLLQAMCRKNAGYMRERGLDAERLIGDSALYLDATAQQSATMLRRWISML